MKNIFTTFMIIVILTLSPALPCKGQNENKLRGTPSPKENSLQASTKVDIVLVLDNSGSMKKNDPQFLTREVVRNFVDGLNENSHLGMVIFGKEAELAEPLAILAGTAARIKFLASLEKVDYSGQFTNSPAGIERAIYELKTNARSDAKKIIIFLTDGIVDTGDKDRDIEKEKWLKEDLAEESKLEEIHIFGVAFTDKADFRLIQSLALKTDGEYYRAYKAEDIEGVFADIYSAISKPSVTPEIVRPQVETAMTETPQTGEPKSEAAKPDEPKIDTSQKTGLSPDTAPDPDVVDKKGISPILIIAGIALAGIIILMMLFKGKSKKPDAVMRPEAYARRGEVAMPKVELIDTKKVVSDQPLKIQKRSVRIGRDPSNDIIIAQDTVSSLHAVIEFKEGYFYLEDQRSSNGTLLNNQKIEPNKSFRLKSGDSLKFDIFEFTFSIPGQARAGQTILSGKEPAPDGTTLRAPEPKDQAPAAKTSSPAEGDPVKPDSALAGKKPAPTEQESATRIKPDMCPNHTSLKATELCPVCKKAFCQKCMTEKDGKVMCSECAKKTN